ncbi:gfo/Idh/MocA family oxidoreductase [Streptomyces sp. Ru71]|uniref:Gfo/Idh/MocA family protein n=1 Tax=Streptomyces sp. Ru71 TaxID=2080746 RepID=UPI000CDE233E|nr:Gfo/Idh/MocA family oxidoreductase [Streptomyces sp. Ru71]POX44829.1 gfo/Idh/MocA family oxidoreductase [Streptomyces sp. Ru71]
MTGIGVVGAGGWASVGHLPALAGLPEFTVTGVATTRRASAERVAAAHGVPHAFVGAAELAAHPDVDVVVVSVKVPDHAEAVRAALAAGKHVVSEWPLGVDAEEARSLADAAREAGVRHAVVLQGVHSPDVRFVADLLADGRLGRLESAVLVADGDAFGGSTIPADLAWTLDPAAGASIVSIMAGHFLATLERITGPLTSVSARLPVLHDEVTVEGTGQRLRNGTPSHVLLHGTLAGDATVSVAVHGGDRPDAVGFYLKLACERGTVTAKPRATGMFMHWTDWDITVDGEPVAVPAAYRTVPDAVPAGPAVRIAELYRDFARALAEDRPARPDFDEAVRVHRLLATVERSAASGARELSVGHDPAG